jgi:hypothetical protein
VGFELLPPWSKTWDNCSELGINNVAPSNFYAAWSGLALNNNNPDDKKEKRGRGNVIDDK